MTRNGQSEDRPICEHCGEYVDQCECPGVGAAVIRWTIEVNREDLRTNDITKPPEEWEPEDLALADRLGLIYAWEVEVDPSSRGRST
jgi:hypothetical protein